MPTEQRLELMFISPVLLAFRLSVSDSRLISLFSAAPD